MSMPESVTRAKKMVNIQKDIWNTKAYSEKFLRLQREKTYSSDTMLSVALDIPPRFVRITDDFLNKRASFDKLAKDNRFTKTFIKKMITYVLDRYNAAGETAKADSDDMEKIKHYIDTAPISFRTGTYICKKIKNNPELTLTDVLMSLNVKAYKLVAKNCHDFGDFKQLNLEDLILWRNCPVHVANRIMSAVEKACADELLDEFTTLYPVSKEDVSNHWMRKNNTDIFTELVIQLRNGPRIIWIKAKTDSGKGYNYAMLENIETINKEELANASQWSREKAEGEQT